MRTRQIDQVMPNLTAKLVGSPDSIGRYYALLVPSLHCVCMCVECTGIDEMMYGHVSEEGLRQSAARFQRRSPQCAAHGPLTAVTIPISIYWSLLQFINSIIYAVYSHWLRNSPFGIALARTLIHRRGIAVVRGTILPFVFFFRVVCE